MVIWRNKAADKQVESHTQTQCHIDLFEARFTRVPKCCTDFLKDKATNAKPQTLYTGSPGLVKKTRVVHQENRTPSRPLSAITSANIFTPDAPARDTKNRSVFSTCQILSRYNFKPSAPPERRPAKAAYLSHHAILLLV